MVYEVGFDQDSESFFVLTKLTKTQLARCILHIMEIADKLIIDSHVNTRDICTILIRHFDCNLTSVQECDHISEYDLWNGGVEVCADFDVSNKTEHIKQFIEANCVTWNNQHSNK